jgi:hypothetical protein
VSLSHFCSNRRTLTIRLSLSLSLSNRFVRAYAFNQTVAKWDVSNVMDATRAFARTKSFDQNLCVWARTLPINASVDFMFTGSGCPSDFDPSWRFSPPGPFCYFCDGSQTPPSGMPSSTPSTTYTPTALPTALPTISPFVCQKRGVKCAKTQDCCLAGKKNRCFKRKCVKCSRNGKKCKKKKDCCSIKCLKKKGQRKGKCKK